MPTLKRSHLPDPTPAYLARRQALQAQLADMDSKGGTKAADQALFVSDLVVAAVHDIVEVVKRAGEVGEAQSAENLAHLADVVKAFHSEVDQALAPEPDGDPCMNRFLAAVRVLEARTAMNVVQVDALRTELLQDLGIAWIELIERFFLAENRKIWFDRLQVMFDYGSTKLPVVGPILELIQAFAEAYAVKRKQAKDADAYLLSLESYVDAAAICLEGAMAFCESAHRMLDGAAPPAQADVRARIAAHIRAVALGTHAVSGPLAPS